MYTQPPSPPPAVQQFGFGFAFGDNMVLQQAPSKAAVYGFVSPGATAVKVTVSSAGKVGWPTFTRFSSIEQGCGKVVATGMAIQLS